jgi:uncharacterized tellurite resistance protein B-like protein
MISDPDANTLRGIGLLYLACTHAMDGDLSETERDLIVHKIEGRLVAASERTVYDAVRAALVSYREQDASNLGQTVHAVAEQLRGLLTPEDAAVLLEDLVEMARTDGVVSSPEREFISDVADTLSVPKPAL